MFRVFCVLLTAIWVTACSAHDEQYYRIHPDALKQALQKCPQQSPEKISCDELHEASMRLTSLAFQLRTSPQHFGQEILKLQEIIAKQKKALQDSPEQRDLEKSLKKNQQRLKERLAVVKWLESPER